MSDFPREAPPAQVDRPEVYNTFGRLSIVDVFDFCRRHIKLAGMTTGAALVLAVLHILKSTSLYTAAGQLLIDVKVPYLAAEQWRETGVILDSAQIESQIAVLQSQPVAQSVVQRLNLLEDPNFNPYTGKNASKPKPAALKTDGDGKAAEAAKEPPDPELLRRVAERTTRGLEIRRLGFSYVLEISYTARDPQKAADVANAFMQAYIDDQIAMRAEAARHGTEWLEKRINALRLQMNAASLRVQEFKARRDYSITSLPGSQGGDADSVEAKGLTQTLDELEATALTYRKMFESALQAYTEAEQRQSYAVSSARIISLASPPISTSFPKKKQVLAIALVAGLLLGFGLGLLKEGLQFARSRRGAAPQH